MAEFKELLEKKTKEAEKIIYSYLPKEEGYQKVIFEAMAYSVKAGGKRLRPILMSETAKLFGYEGTGMEPFMAAMEMIHTYSLVHDDLPAMDNDSLRRGMPTTHIKYGHANGVLAGDALLNYAFEIAAGAVLESSDMVGAAKAMAVLAKKAGAYGMIGGQVVDVELTNKPIEKDVLDFIYKLKTSALIEASMMVGAIIAGASDEEIQKIETVANRVGIAFQIQDDILDVEGNTVELGKPVFSDAKNQKTTYVTLYGIEEAKKKVEEYTNEALEILDNLKYTNVFLRDLLVSLVTRKK